MVITADYWTQTNTKALQRSLGASEYAFFPASKDGLGDMFLHLSFRAPVDQLRQERVLNAWALLRNRHPLLACKVVLDNDTPCFSFSPPSTVEEAIEEARTALYFQHSSKHDLISSYMNGSRTLSDTHLSYLVISVPSSSHSNEAVTTEHDYDLLMCAPHFTGDGTSLHQCTHDLLALLASSASDEELLTTLDISSTWDMRLPPAFEARCITPQGRFAQAVSKVHSLLAREKEIGGHRFDRHQRASQNTVFVERVFTQTETKGVLRRCKENGVTINHALEAVCGLAWARVTQTSAGRRSDKFKDPIMLYTAINLRSHLTPTTIQNPTYWFLALTYFTLVLPSFPPTSKSAFWLRAKSAKIQTHAAVQSPLLIHRALEMATERAERVRGRTPRPTVDVQGLLGRHPPEPSYNPDSSNLQFKPRLSPLLPGPAPSTALLGLSLIGNLDVTYDRRAYPTFVLHDVTTASRQKAGGILLLVHTFGGKLWLQMFYDREGFGDSGEVDRFWEEVERGVEEYLIE